MPGLSVDGIVLEADIYKQWWWNGGGGGGGGGGGERERYYRLPS